MMHYRYIKKLADENVILKPWQTLEILNKHNRDFDITFIGSCLSSIECRIIKVSNRTHRRYYRNYYRGTGYLEDYTYRIDSYEPKIIIPINVFSGVFELNALLVFNYNDFIRCLVSYSGNPFKCKYNEPYFDILKNYTKHLRWILETEGIDYSKSRFLMRKHYISSMEDERELYSLDFIKILSTFIKLISYGNKQTKRNACEHEIITGIHILPNGKIKQQRNRCKRGLCTSETCEPGKQCVEL